MSQTHHSPDNSTVASQNQPQKIIAIIPARGGSKGIPRKNLVLVNGLPLLAYSIRQAAATPEISRVFVTTDVPEIAAVAKAHHAEVITRPDAISGDDASSESALLHVLDHLNTHENYQPDIVIFLQATSPIRQANDIHQALQIFKTDNLDALFSACAVEGFTWRVKQQDVSPVNYNPTRRPMRQDLAEHIIEENGSIYIFKPWVLRQFNSRLGGKIGYVTMDRLSSYQVDRPEDIPAIQAIMNFLNIT